MHQFKNLKKFKNVVHGISTVGDGSMNIFRVDAVPKIRKLLKNTVFKDIKEERIVFTEQVHGNKIKSVKASDGGSIKLGVDGSATKEKNVLLVVKSADCLPILFYDSVNNVIAAVHCGFLGIIRKILPKTIKFLRKEFGCRPENLIVGIGPHISQENYQLHEKKLKMAKNKPEFKKFLKGEKFSLKDAAIWQLTKTGILKKNIEIMDICTFANPKIFFSHRFDKLHPGFYKEESNMFGTFIGSK